MVSRMERIKPKIGKGIRAVRMNYRLILAFMVLLLSVLVVYGNDFGILANEALKNEAFSHVLLFPFFLGFLFYLKKDVVKASLSLDDSRKRARAKYVNELRGVVF